MLNPSFKELVRELYQSTKAVDDAIAQLNSTATKINAKYDPRTEFIRWRDSQEGKFWKQQQYLAQSQCCAICKQSIRLEGSHIDHIKPLSSYPHLALEPQNLQIACPNCNISKGNKL